MKKFILSIIYLLSFTLFATSQEQTTTKMRDVIKEGPVYTHEPDTIPTRNKEAFYILLNSNIEYAQIGAGFIFNTSQMKTPIILNIKVSADYLTRERIIQTAQKYNPSQISDINNIIITTAFLFNLTENIDYWFGAGIFTGHTYQLNSYRENIWTRVDQKVGTHPVLTWGGVLTKKRVKLLLGYDVAWAKQETGPFNRLNTNSFVKLTSATIGIALSLKP